MPDGSLTPAVVLGCFRHGGLGIVRSLGRLSVPVHVVDSGRRAPAYYSRYCHEKSLWDIDSAPTEQSVAFLLELGKKIGRRSVLIPTSDIGAVFVAEQADRLREWFIFPAADAGLVRSLCSKQDMFYLAQKCGVPTPATAFPLSREDVLEYLETARFPVLVKPVRRLAGRPVLPIQIVRTKEELRTLYLSLEDRSAPNLILQEYIPGPDEMTWTFNGYFDGQGECKLAFTGRKLRNFPPYFGQASLAVCVRNPIVETMTIGFMKAIGYRGPLDLGYRYDSRDGQYKVNDVNPRIGAMSRLFVGQNGIDVARALYYDVTGQPVPAATTPEGRKWIVEDADLMSSLRYRRDGKLALKEWISSLRGVEEAAYFAFDDPLPFAAVVMIDAKSIMERALASCRVRRTSSPEGGPLAPPES